MNNTCNNLSETEIRERRLAARRRRRNKVMALKLTILVVCFAIIVSLGSVIANASVKHSAPNKYYTSITISSDDTLWDIACEYNNGDEDINTYISNIKRINHMSSDTLYKDCSLIVYYYSYDTK
ncbi:MAG: LysM peptidoglycan-binding domain-containing protein [Lachnospira sp.]